MDAELMADRAKKLSGVHGPENAASVGLRQDGATT